MWTLAAAVFTSAAGALPAPAQSAGPVPGAERVARRLFAALDSMRWRQAAALFHPAAQEGFRREQRERAVVMTRSDSAWQARSYGPDTPPAVAAWLAHRDSLSTTRFQQTHLGQFAGVTRPGQLDSLPAAELLARWLEAHDERAELRRTVSRMPPVLVRMFVGDTLAQVRRRVIGSVRENDSTAQVVLRTRSNVRAVPGDPGTVTVLTMRRAPGGWRVWNADPSAIWLGGSSFGIQVEEGQARIAEDLDARRDSTLTWRDAAAGTRVHAAVVGYPGGGRPPRGLLLEVRGADGAQRSVELPYGSLADLLEYALPWILMPPLLAAGKGR